MLQGDFMKKLKYIIGLFFIIHSSLFCAPLDPWKGDAYAKHSTSQEDSAKEFFKKLHLESISSILDIGCGDGKITAFMAQSFPESHVLGIDISPSQIQTAKTAFTFQDNLQFDIQDAADLHVDREFDLITSFTVMHWVLSQAKALEGCYHALKQGGRLCIQMPTHLPTAMEQALQQVLSHPNWEPYFLNFAAPWHFYSLEAYHDLLLNAHLIPIKLEVVTKHEYFSSRKVFHHFLKQWFPYLRTLPSEKHDLFLSDLLDAYFTILPVDDQGRVSFIVDRLEVQATK
jgi:trans-aconitate methyltransferase